MSPGTTQSTSQDPSWADAPFKLEAKLSSITGKSRPQTPALLSALTPVSANAVSPVSFHSLSLVQHSTSTQLTVFVTCGPGSSPPDPNPTIADCENLASVLRLFHESIGKLVSLCSYLVAFVLTLLPRAHLRPNQELPKPNSHRLFYL